MSEPRQPVTLAERLDSAQSGEEFGNVILGLFNALDRAREDSDE